jgi:hypothetical protein
VGYINLRIRNLLVGKHDWIIINNNASASASASVLVSEFTDCANINSDCCHYYYLIVAVTAKTSALLRVTVPCYNN